MKVTGLLLALVATCVAPSVAAQNAASSGATEPAITRFVQVGRLLADPEQGSVLRDKTLVIRGDRVVEIGPGMGILTRELLARGANVLAVELDTDLVSLLSHELGEEPNFTLIERDARHVDVSEWTGGDSWRVVANLPYSTGTVIIRHFLEMEHPPSTLTVMVQKEVAERMVAVVPDMSLLSLAVLLVLLADGGGPLAAAREFKEMVKVLHGEGIEVIVDVVYNHTVEGE